MERSGEKRRYEGGEESAEVVAAEDRCSDDREALAPRGRDADASGTPVDALVWVHGLGHTEQAEWQRHLEDEVDPKD